MNNKKLLIGGGFILLLALLVIFIYLMPDRQNQRRIDQSQNQDQSQTSSDRQQNFKIISVSPAEDLNSTFMPIKEIVFTFNSPISENQVFSQITPNQQVTFKIETNKLKILPKTKWLEELTTIKILKSTKSIYGGSLGLDFEYKINFLVPVGIEYEFDPIAPTQTQ